MVVTNVTTMNGFRKESYNTSTNHLDPTKGPGSNTTIITTARAVAHEFDTTPKPTAKKMESRGYPFIYAKPGEGGWLAKYIEAKVELYKDGGKGGEKQHLIDYTNNLLKQAAIRSRRPTDSSAADTDSSASSSGGGSSSSD